MTHLKCPSCNGGEWKTLEALALTQRHSGTAVTKSTRRGEQWKTSVISASEAAQRYAEPLRPDDYDQMQRYRSWCDDSVANAEEKLARIDAASDDALKELPGFFSGEPDGKSVSFHRFSGKLEGLIRYEEALARWKATRLCTRCATTFIPPHLLLPSSPPLVFRFKGQDRHCRACGSYYWKQPDVIAKHREAVAKLTLEQARKILANAETFAARVGTEAPQTGWLARFAAAFTPREIGVAEAQAKVVQAELVYNKTRHASEQLRAFSRNQAGARWCAKCESTYVCA
jgi:hypothetical protein